jgi:hypothetical protein
MATRHSVDWKDPLLIVSILLAITGAIQASTGYFSDMMTAHPIRFGLGMTAVSIVTGVLTVVKSYIAAGEA